LIAENSILFVQQGHYVFDKTLVGFSNEKRKPVSVGGVRTLFDMRVFFIASGIKNQDILTLLGSIAFFVAFILFLIPILNAGKKIEDDVLRC